MKNNLFSRILCGILAGVLCIGLTGCGGDKDANGSTEAGQSATVHYTCATATIQGDFYNAAFQKPIVLGGRLQLVQYLTLTSCGLDSSDRLDWEAPNYYEKTLELPNGWVGDWELLGPFPAGDDGMYLLDKRSFEYTDGENNQGWLFLYHMNADGEMLESQELSLPRDFPSYFDTDTTIFTDNTLYQIQWRDQKLYRLSLDDGTLQRYDMPENFTYNQIFLLPDGRLLVLGRQAQPGEAAFINAFFNYYCTFSPDTGAFDAPAPLPGALASSTATIFAADETGWLFWNGSGIFRYDLGGQTVEQLCRWLDCDIIPSFIINVAALDEGRFLAVCQNDRTDLLEMLTLTPTDPQALEEVTTLTLGITDPLKNNIPGLAQAIVQFNRSHTDIHVQIVDYSAYDEEDSGIAGWQKMDQDIINNCAPDIIIGSVDDSYYEKGVFQDLYPLLDADPELSREDFLAGPLRAGEIDGQLLMLMPAFHMQTLIGPSALVGDEPGWTLEEFFALARQHQAVRAVLPYDRDMTFSLLFHFFMPLFVDKSAGSCDFTSQGFLDLLAHCRDYPTVQVQPGENWCPNSRELFAAGDALVEMESLGNVSNPFRDLRIYTYDCDGDFTIKGYPTADGSAGSFVGANQSVMLSANCSDPDAAWTFIRSLLLPDFQYIVCHSVGDEANGYAELPLRRDTVAGLAEEAMRESAYVSNLPQYLDWNTVPWDDPYWTRAVTREEADKLIDALETAASSEWDYTIHIIVLEEVDAYFAGDCTAEEVAGYIQGRVSTYLAERK